MVKKKQKLSRRDFTSLLQQGKRIHSTSLSLTYLPAKETKLGVVVSKKIANKAVLRNKFRRRIFSILGKNLTLIENIHIAVFTKPTCTSLSYQDLQEELEVLLRKIHSKR